MAMASGHRRPSGFTLMEVLLASAILAFIVAALAQAVVAGQRHTYDALHESRAIGLAESLIDEVLLLPYHDPQGDVGMGPDAGETDRGLFDNLDDYDGYEQAIGEQADPAGRPLPALYRVFSRSVTVAPSPQPVAALGGQQMGVRIDVRVTDESGRSWTLSRWVPEPAE